MKYPYASMTCKKHGQHTKVGRVKTLLSCVNDSWRREIKKNEEEQEKRGRRERTTKEEEEEGKSSSDLQDGTQEKTARCSDIKQQSKSSGSQMRNKLSPLVG